MQNNRVSAEKYIKCREVHKTITVYNVQVDLYFSSNELAVQFISFQSISQSVQRKFSSVQFTSLALYAPSDMHSAAGRTAAFMSTLGNDVVCLLIDSLGGAERLSYWRRLDMLLHRYRWLLQCCTAGRHWPLPLWPSRTPSTSDQIRSHQSSRISPLRRDRCKSAWTLHRYSKVLPEP